MEQYGKKRIQKKLPKVLSFQQLLHIYSKGATCVNKYIIPLKNATYREKHIDELRVYDRKRSALKRKQINNN